MAVSVNEIEQVLRQSFPDAKIKIKDLANDQEHYSLEIADQSFVGLSLIEQHKRVKSAITSILHTKLHAITIKTIIDKR